MKSWGRFQIVSDKTQADLIFLLTTHAETYGYVTTGGNQVGSVDDSGNMATTASPYTTANPSFYSGLAILDAKTGKGLWAESKGCCALSEECDQESRRRIEKTN
jgi:hypothetical protein